MDSKRIVLGIGIVLAILVVFTAPAMAGPNTMYFTNWTHPTTSGGSSEDGEITYVELWLNLTDLYGSGSYGLKSVDINITTNEAIGDIIACNEIPGHPWDAHWNANLICHDGVWLTVLANTYPPNFGLDPGVYPVANLTIKGNNSGVTDLHFSYELPRKCNMFDSGGADYPNQTWEDGTYTCTGPAETFEKELVAGWNLISLPLTADNMEVASVFASVSGNYSAVHRYDAETKHFVALNGTNVLEYGVGYFIHMTSADTWTYQGTAYSSMSVDLKQGLNMVGWLNGTKDIEDALSSIAGKYRYVARWNSTTDKFEVYVPNAPAEFNDFDTMEQGRSYFVSMKVDGETLSEVC